MAGAWFVIGLFVLAIITAALKIYVTYFMPRHISFGSVNPSPVDYDNRAPAPPVAARDFRAFRPEVEAEAAPEVAVQAAPGMVVITENALQERLAEAREEGMVHLFAALQKGGYLPTGKATEIKRLAFGVGGGRRLQRLNDAIDAVALPGAEPPAAEATPPRVVKVREGRPDERALALD